MSGLAEVEAGHVCRHHGGRMLLPRLLALLAIALVYFAWPNLRPDFTPFNAHDSESYLTLSYSLVHGLGYTRNMVEGAYIPHTTWPPGLPVLLMPALAASGETVNWWAVKGTILIIGLSGVVLAWFYARRLTGSRITADVAALFLALNPFYWHFSRIAMTEVPVTVWLIGGLLLVDALWAGRPVRAWEAGSCGLLLGLGMLIKGTVLGLGLVPLAYLAGARQAALPRAAQIRRWLVYAVAFSLPFLVWAARNHMIDTAGLGFDGIDQARMILAADPLDPNSPLRGLAAVLADMRDTVRYHLIYEVPQQMIPGLWALDRDAWPGGPAVALGLAVLVLVFCLPRRWAALPIALAVLPMALLTIVLAEGGATRYWVPVLLLALLALTIQLAPALDRLAAEGWRRAALYIVLITVLTLNLGVYIRDFEHEPYNRRDAWRELALLFERVAASPIAPRAVATPNPHAFALMTGHPAPMTNVARGITPRYSHVVLRGDRPAALPPGSDVLIEVAPWRLVALPQPMPLAEIERFLGPATPW